ncbi:MAG: ParB N-terminal domain-containing protein [Rhabdochlamydiaceae bacterium]
MQAAKFPSPVVRDIPISEIKLGDERCLGDIENLKRSILEIGLLQPINITTDKKLISGYHRLLAVKELGWKSIPCKLSEYDSLHMELAKLDENLIRNYGTELERATWLAREKEIYETLHPETMQHVSGGKARQGSATDKMSFARSVSRKICRDERTVRRAVMIGRELEPFKEKLLGRPISDNQKELLALSKVEPRIRKDLVDILAQGKANHLWEAKRIARSNELKFFAVPKELKLILGDFRQEGKKIPNHSIDLIFTDLLTARTISGCGNHLQNLQRES